MFNRKKVAEIEGEVRYQKQRTDEIYEERRSLRILINRAVKTIVPMYLQSPHIDSCSNLEIYLNKLDQDAKARVEREKIEQIVLDLKNRKWEPAE